MPVVVIGVNHRTAPLELLERMTIRDVDTAKALHALLSGEHLSEAVVLSTCNRTEVYAVAEKFHGGYGDVRNVLGELAYLTPDEFADHLYVHHDTEAVHHLFSVVAGLDSAVLGEHEIQGQVRVAWETAQAENAVGPTLNLLFRHAVEAGKRARSETAIGRGTASVSYSAVALADEHLGGLARRKAIVLGAGEMGQSMATALSDSDVGDLVVCNRTFDKAKALARTLDGRPARLAELADELATTDVLLSSTGAAGVLVSRDDIEAAVAQRAGRPLLIVDIAVPRDIDPTVAELPGVTVLDMDDLRRFAESGLAERRREVDAVRAILAEEVERYRSVISAREAAPAIVALRDAAESVRLNELDRHQKALAALDPSQRAAVEHLTRGLVQKLLHQPTVAVKDAAGTAKGDRLVQAVRELFELD